MKSAKWICNICKQTLTRKWNAKRHCNIKHGGLFDSIIPFREYLITTTSVPHISPTNHTDPPFKINNSNQLPFKENLFSQEKSIPIPKSSYWHQTIPQRDIIKDDDHTKREKLLSNIIERIVPRYEEIRNLLSHFPEPIKKKILGGLVCNALASDNPIKIIDNQLKILRNAKFYNIIIDDASFYLGFNKQMTKEYLKMGLKENKLT